LLDLRFEHQQTLFESVLNDFSSAFSPKGVFFESVVKNVRITFSHSLLETIFCLKFIDNAPLNLTQKLAKELCLSQFACPKKIGYLHARTQSPTVSCPIFRASIFTLRIC